MKQKLTLFFLPLLLQTVNLSAQCPFSVDAGPDVFACTPPGPAMIQLNADVPAGATFEWLPPVPAALSKNLSPSFTFTGPVTTFKIRALMPDNSTNLIVNGDFEQGNTGFTSGAAYSPGDLTPPDTYDVLTNPQDANPVYSPCPDHTTGKGNMLVVHPTGDKGLTVWCQTVPVEPNFDYTISFWVTRVGPGVFNDNKYQLFINGVKVHEAAPGGLCTWKEIKATWNSGGSTTAEICIELTKAFPNFPNKPLQPFALDDIVMHPPCVLTDSVKVVVKTLSIAPSVNYTVPCAESPITINGSTGTTLGEFITYEWSTPDGNFVSGTNTLTPVIDQAGSYWLNLKFQSPTHTCELETGFVAKEGAPLLVNILQTKPITCFVPHISLKALPSNAQDIAYAWVADQGGNIISGANTATPIVNQPGLYSVTITNTKTGCTATTEHIVNPPEPPPVAQAAATSITCAQTQATLSGAGSTTGSTITYLWTTANGSITSDPKKLDATAGSTGTYILQVLNTADGCKTFDTIQVSNNLAAPVLVAAPAPVLQCKPDTVTLAATVTPAGSTLLWTGPNIVSGNNSLQPKVSAAGTYTLTATNPANGCTASASVAVPTTVNLNAVAAAPPPLTCSQPTLVLNGTGSSTGPGIKYLWSTTNGLIQSGTNTLTPVVSAPGTYRLLLSDSVSGCSKILDVHVSAEKTAPQIESTPAPLLNCNLPSADLTAVRLDTLHHVAFAWTASEGGNILAGEATLTPTVTAAGLYDLVVTNLDNGCTVSISVPVSADLNPPNVQLAPAPALTCTTLSLDLNATATSTSGQTTYAWTTPNGNIASGNSTASPVVDKAGTYELIVTDPVNGCTSSAATVVTLDQAPPEVTVASAGLLTCDHTSFNLQVSATVSNLQYLWTASNGGNIVSGNNTPTPQIDRAGTYTLLATNPANGCTTEAALPVFANTTPPQAEAGAPLTLTCTTASAALSGSGSTGSNFLYEWTSATGNIVSGANTLTPVVNAAGTYVLVITDQQNGCTATDEVIVQKDANVPTAQIQPAAILDCKIASIQLDATGTSQGANISFSWTTPDGHFLSGQNTLTPTLDKPGEYILNVLNTASNCTVSTAVTVTENRLAPQVQIAPAQGLNCLNTSVTLDATTAAQNPAYVLIWTASNGGSILSGANSLAPTVNAAGTYALLITDPVNGCTATAAVTVGSNTTPPQVEAGPAALLTCTSATLTLSGSGSTGPNFGYEWTTSGGSIASGNTTFNPVVNAAGTYTLKITDTANGCTATDEVVVQKDANIPTALAQTPGILDCKTSLLQLSATGTSQGLTYLWTTAGGNIVSGNTTLNPSVDKPGTYTLLVTNTANNCSATASVTVTEDRTQPTATASAPTVIDCKNATVSLHGNGSSTGNLFNYLWTSTNGNIVSGKNSLTPTVNQAGTYTLLVTNTQNGCTSTASASVTVDKAAPAAQVAAAPQLDCALTSIELNAAGTAQGAGITYLWTTAGSGNIVSGNNTLVPVVDKPGTYQLLVTNTQNGCTATTAVTVSQNIVPPVAAVSPPAMLNCTTTSLALNGNNSSQGTNFTYLWNSSGGGNIVSGGNSLAPVVDKPGLYTLAITNTANHCTATTTVAVAQDIAPPQVTTNAPLTLNCGVNSLTLSATVTGAGSSFETSWTASPGGLILSGANSLTPTVGAAGTYTVVVKNLQNGCTQTTSSEVLKDQDAPLSTAAAPAELTCKVTQVSLSGAGSSTGNNIAYNWTTAAGNIVSGNTTLAPTVSKPGIYVLAVTNTTNNCTATAVVSVLQNIQPPQASAQSTDLLTCAVKQINLTGSGTGGNSGVAYAWTGPQIVSGANTASPTINAAGTYLLTVTDLYNGCTATSQAIASQDVALPVAAIAPPAVLNCLIKTTDLKASVSSPASGQYSVVWSGQGIQSGGTTLAPTVNQPGIYTLQVTNAINGCTASATASVTQDIQPPLAKAGGGFELNCTVEEGTLSAAGSSIGAQFQYMWSSTGGNIVSGGSSPSPVVDAAGSYLLTINNLQNHCSSTSTVQVTQNTNVPTAIALEQQPPNCQKATGSVQVTEITGGQGPFLYSLDGGTTFGSANQFKKIAPGIYTLLVQDANGCEHEQSFTFDPPVQPTVTPGPDVKMVFGEKSQLTATVNLLPDQIASITWSPMEGLTPTADPLTMIAHPLKSTYYTVKVVNKDGCEDKVTLRVQVDEPHLWAPNVFSPGHKDGNNDFFLIFASDNSVQTIQTLQIFDRWGNMVFQNKNLQPNVEKMGWDGSFRGKTVQPAVFVWYAEILLYDGRVILMKGDVTVVD